MADTRRGNGSKRPVIDELNYTHGEGEDNDTIHVQTTHSSKVCNAPITPKPSTTVSTATPSSAGGMMDINLTSPSIIEPTPRVTTTMCKRKRAEPPVVDRTLSSSLRRLAAKPGDLKGSVDNPIDLEAYSPRRKQPAQSKRQQLAPEPHRFHKRNQKLHRFMSGYDAPRTPLAPKTANVNGVRFTGHKGDDMSRMLNAKRTAVGYAPPIAAYQAPPPTPYAPKLPSKPSSHYGMSFEAAYPISSAYLAQPSTCSYTQYHTSMGLSLSGYTESTLRKRALQIVRESTRAQHHSKTNLSDDIDETSEDSDATVLAESGAKLDRPIVPVYMDSPHSTSTLVAQNALLTSLLRIYPTSSDQEGLRDDISLLSSSAYRSVKAWASEEDRRCERGALEAVRVRKAVERLLERQDKERDREVRGLLSAGAKIWGDGSVVGVENGQDTGLAIVVEDEVRTKGVCGWDMVR